MDFKRVLEHINRPSWLARHQQIPQARSQLYHVNHYENIEKHQISISKQADAAGQ